MPTDVQIFTDRAAPASQQARDGDLWKDPQTAALWVFHAGNLRRLLLSVASTLGIGYGAGAGGVVTQATDKSTGVTLNRPSGQITMNNATLNAGVEVSFTLTNSVIEATDVVVVNHGSAGTAGAYLVGIGAIAAGSCVITVSNASAGNLGEAIVLNYAVIKGASA